MSVESGRPLRQGELVELVIEKDVYRGRGLGRVSGRVVFVPRAHAGDRVRARVAEAHADFLSAELVEVLDPAEARREAPCPYAARCGGCAYQQLGYEAQLRAKEAVLRESLARAGAPWDGAIEVHPSPERGWRMRASLHFSVERGALRLGLQQEGRHLVVDVLDCLQLSTRMNEVARAFRARLQARPALVGRLSGLDLVESPQGEELVASLDTTLRPREALALAPLARELGLSGFGVRCGSRSLWLHGEKDVLARVLGIGFRAHVRRFFQGNRFLLEPLARTVLELVPRGAAPLLDLYAGVGLFALPLAARDGCDATAVELSWQASEDARRTAERAGLSRVRVIAGDVAETLARLPRTTGERVVLDPPRTGAGPEVVDGIAGREPSAVVYVSCDPATLGRDLARFARHGYRARSVSLFDLFPDTFHLETVVALARGV